jgi:hypothetical protein
MVGEHSVGHVGERKWGRTTLRAEVEGIGHDFYPKNLIG